MHRVKRGKIMIRILSAQKLTQEQCHFFVRESLFSVQSYFSFLQIPIQGLVYYGYGTKEHCRNLDTNYPSFNNKASSFRWVNAKSNPQMPSANVFQFRPLAQLFAVMGTITEIPFMSDF